MTKVRQNPKKRKPGSSTKPKKARGPISVEEIIVAAQQAIENLDIEEAIELYKRALQLEPTNTNTMDALADLLLQAGDVDSAFELLQRSTSLAPDANGIKWMYLAQLLRGEESVQAYNKGIRLLTDQLAALPSTADAAQQRKALTKELVSAYCGVSELYMTDLCFEPSAEESCETAIMNALVLDSSSTEALQTLASLRISQCRKGEACDILEPLFHRLDTKFTQLASRNLRDELLCSEDDVEALNDMPTQEHCIAFVKLLLECAPERPILAQHSEKLLQHVLLMDDENPEVWYLLGMSNLALATPDHSAATEAFTHCKALLTAVLEQIARNPASSDPATVQQIQSLLCAVEEAEKDVVQGETEGGAMEQEETAAPAAQSQQPQFSAHAFLQGGEGVRGPAVEEEEEAWSTDDEDRMET